MNPGPSAVLVAAIAIIVILYLPPRSRSSLPIALIAFTIGILAISIGSCGGN